MKSSITFKTYATSRTYDVEILQLVIPVQMTGGNIFLSSIVTLSKQTFMFSELQE